jgi:membrane protein
MVARLRRLGELVVYVARRFQADGALDKASSLAYTSLLSLVPLLAIALAMLAAFPVFDKVRDQIQALIFQNFVPAVGEQVQRTVSGFVANAGKLTAAGVIGLVFSAVMLLVTIESTLNAIFRVATPRSPVSRLLVYWTAVTLGPLLMGASFSMSAWFFAAQDWASRWGLSGLVSLVTGATPNVLLMISFTLLYIAVPNRRVRTQDALIGGLAAALAFAALRFGFALYITGAHAYQSVYGAVAAVPIFLFWMYLSWVVVLSGAELAAALPEWRLSREDLGGPLPAHRRLSLALSVLASLAEEARHGGKGRSRRNLLDAVGEGEPPLVAVLERLGQHGFIVVTDRGRYVLGRDLTHVSLGHVVHALDLGLGGDQAGDCAEPWMCDIADRLRQAAGAEASALDLPLRHLLDQAGNGVFVRMEDSQGLVEDEG